MTWKIHIDSPLGQFLMGTFNQDWKCDFATSWDAVEDFLARSDSQSAHAVWMELEEWIRSAVSTVEVPVSDVLSNICDYVPPQGCTRDAYLVWLGEVNRQFCEFLNHNQGNGE